MDTKDIWEGYDLAFPDATKDNPLPVKEGFTPEQRFFLAYAGVWGQNITEAEIRRLTTIDPHSLGEWRVNGALPLLDAWYEAFGITEADPLFVPEEKRSAVDWYMASMILHDEAEADER